MREGMHNHYKAVIDELRRMPAVLNVAAADARIPGMGNETYDTWWEGKDPSKTFLITFTDVNEDFIPTLKMHLAAGSNFTGSPADSTHYILNETAVKAIGMKGPDRKEPLALHDIRGTIIGVVKDFNFASLKDPVKPLIFSYDSTASGLYIRTRPGQATDAIAAVRHSWQQYDAAYPFSYSFLDDDIDKIYRTDQRDRHPLQCLCPRRHHYLLPRPFRPRHLFRPDPDKGDRYPPRPRRQHTQVTSLLAKDFVALIGSGLRHRRPHRRLPHQRLAAQLATGHS